MNELLNIYDMTYSDYESHIQGIVDSITKGEKQDQYKDWAKHPDVSVREALVKNGYELGILIHDPLSSMRMEVVRKDPTYIKEALHYKLSTTDWQTVYQELIHMIDPDPEVLIAFMRLGVPEGLTEYESTYHNTFELFRLQIEGANIVQTTLERTMMRKQLYNQKHPTWTRGLRVREALLQYEECAEILANDPVDEIRAGAVLYHPQYVNCLIGKPGIETFIAMQKVLVEQATPEQEAYDYYMENIERFELDYKQEIKDTDEEVIKRYRKLNKVLAEKYEAMKLPVTTLASTMTWEQLREAGNPLWMVNKTAKEIAKLQKN